ncbi:TRL-like family protein [Saccharicrinis aurantiacus]|uniref:TRL-like family protein n=1 Tax=Saccharicrinis aurantiacus TaxID=1849719 RepID=UPI00094F6940|nr:TRL-like family protein [Saccharicrinis aurantiacus]
MKKFKSLAAAFIGAALLSSCTMTMPVATTSNPTGSKVGTSKATMIIGLSFGQDASISKAAKAGGIKTISTVDQKHTNVLGIYQTFETIVSGE